MIAKARIRIAAVWQQVREGGNGFTDVGRRFLLSDGCALCGDADASGRVTAIDALAALRAGVGFGTCTPDRCDTDGSLTITATDALRILGAAVAAGPPALSCGASS